LINILALDLSKVEDVKKVQDMMTAAGLQHRIKEGGDSEDRAAWYWDGSVTEANSGITIGQDLLVPLGMVHLPEERYAGYERAAANALMIYSFRHGYVAKPKSAQKKIRGGASPMPSGAAPP
jgi:hypothetical protein